MMKNAVKVKFEKILLYKCGEGQERVGLRKKWRRLS